LKAVIAREGGGSANLNFRPLAVAPPLDNPTSQSLTLASNFCSQITIFRL